MGGARRLTVHSAQVCVRGKHPLVRSSISSTLPGRALAEPLQQHQYVTYMVSTWDAVMDKPIRAKNPPESRVEEHSFREREKPHNIGEIGRLEPDK